MKLAPATGYHVATDYPIKLTLEAPAGVTLAKTELTAGGRNKVQGDAETLSEQAARVRREGDGRARPARTRSRACSSSASVRRTAATRRSSRSRSPSPRTERDTVRRVDGRAPRAGERDAGRTAPGGAGGLHAQPPRDVVLGVPGARVRRADAPAAQRRRSTSSTASTTTAARRSAIRGATSRRFKLFDAPWAERRGPPVRPGDGPERGLSDPPHVRAGRPAEQADPAARSERLGEVDVHPLPRPRPRALLDARRGRAVSVQLDLPGAEAHEGRHRLRRSARRSRRSSRSRTCPTIRSMRASATSCAITRCCSFRSRSASG